MNIIIFEDYNIKNLSPFSINHSSFELKCGVYTNLERIVDCFDNGTNYYLIVRDELKQIVQEKFPRYTVNPKEIPKGIYLNGAALWSEDNIKKIKNGYAFSSSGNLIAFISDVSISYNDIGDMINKTSKVTSDINIDYISYLWDCIDLFSKYLDYDIKETSNLYQLDDLDFKINPENFYFSKDCIIEPGCILDGSNGPIVLGKNVKIESGSIIKGPIFIDEGSIINNGTKLKGNILIGPYCKVAGEITNSIFYGYSNKQHDGFLGHSFIGEWVNLGANTNNSNLKNNYSKIKFNFSDTSIIDTKRLFLGVMIGDFCRTGISTMINTGSYFGLGSNIFGAGFQNKYIPSFNWGQNEIVDFNKFITTIKKMKTRRTKEVSNSEVLFLQNLYNLKTK
tara:strand:+ start:2600 stop:3781 length:1182 start_codon:yes stop_codon:yes gene_type:complete